MYSSVKSMNFLRKADLIPYNSSQKIEVTRTLPISLYELSINLIPKPGKDITRKKNYRPISHEYRCKRST